MIPPSEIRELGIKDYLNIAKKNIWIIAISVFFVTAVTAFYNFSQAEVYEVALSLLVRTEVPEITGREEIIYRKGLYTQRDQMELLTSYGLAQRVARSLGLDAEDESMVKRLLSLLNRTRSPRDSDVVNVFFQGEDPSELVRVANTWGQEFSEAELEEKRRALDKGIEALRQEKEDVRGKINSIEEEITWFVREHQLDKVPDVILEGEASLENIKEKEEELMREIRSLGRIYGQRHPRMLSLEKELKDIRELLDQRREDLFARQEVMGRYRELQNNLEVQKNLIEEYESRVRDFELSRRMITSNVNILDRARLPSRPISPRPGRNILLAFFLSIGLGAGAAYFRELLDSTLHTSEDVELYTNLSFFGEVYLERNREERSAVKAYSTQSILAESFMKIKVALAFSFPQEKALRVLGVNSSVSGEGKTFCTAHIASAFASSGDKTLAIDGDLRKGSLSSFFNQKSRKGLSNFLTGESSFEEVIHKTSLPNLYLLSRGPFSPNPIELLHSKKLDEVFQLAKNNFKRVVVDMPPVLVTADVLLLGTKCDTNLLVIEADKTNLNTLLRSIKILEKKVKVIGAILNKAVKQQKNYYYYESK